MPNVVAAIHHDIVSPDTRLPDWALSGHVWICLIMLVLAPLSFLKHLDSLRHTSFIALFAVGTRIDLWPPDECTDRWRLISVPCRCRNLRLLQTHGRCSGTRGDPPHSLYLHVRVNFPGPGLRFHLCPECKLGSLFRRCFYSRCVVKLFPIYNELNGNTQRRMNIVIGTSIGSAIGIYEIIGVFGYLTFGSKVCPGVLELRGRSSHYGRLEPMLSRCTPPLRSSLPLDNWPSQYLSCSRTRYRFIHAATASTRFSTSAAG